MHCKCHLHYKLSFFSLYKNVFHKTELEVNASCFLNWLMSFPVLICINRFVCKTAHVNSAFIIDLYKGFQYEGVFCKMCCTNWFLNNPFCIFCSQVIANAYFLQKGF